MKTKLLISALFFFGIKNFSQTSANLDLNNISAPINSGGDLFWNFQSAGFEVPKASGLHTIFAGNLWIAGYDQGGQLHAAAQTYRQTGSDFFQGPMMDYWNYSSTTDAQWNKVWKIRKTTIDSFKLGFFGNNIPQIIMNWPANGNVSLGEAQVLAPFFDVNNDNIYDPLSGDYPLINGDMAICFIFNDDRNPHTETGGQKLGIEIHGMAYAFICGDNAIDNTIFLHYDIFNRSANTYHNVHAGLWIDFDLGLYSDDYEGCDTTRNAFYVYNGMDTDMAYGLHPPAQGVLSLSRPLSNFMYYNNNSTNFGNPNGALNIYRYLNSQWRDGTHLMHNNAPTNFAYSGNPVTHLGWTMPGDSLSPADVRGLGSVFLDTLAAGNMKALDFAFVYGRGVNTTNLTNITVMKQRMDVIQNSFNYNMTPCGGSFFSSVADHHADQNSISIYPNPASDILFIDYKQTNLNTMMEIYDITGKKIYSGRLESFGKNQVSVKELSDGLYFIRIIDGNKVYSKKFVKE